MLRAEENRRFIASVGSPSNDRDKSRGPPIAINHDRYNSLDGTLRLNVIQLNLRLVRCRHVPLSK